MAGQVDAVYWFVVAITAFFTLLIYLLVAVFAVRYRRGNRVDRSNPPGSNHKLEAVWISLPLLIVIVLFVWSTNVFFKLYRAPANAQTIYCVGKQWMWKFQSPDGTREIDELHVPVGRAVRVQMISQDVIHSLYFPAFRVKQDVLPGRYTQLWFEPTKVGDYHIFCAEYCGTEHSGMIGTVHVMTPEDYQSWLSGATGGTAQSPAQAGEQLFTQSGCPTCHVAGAGTRAPSLAGVYGSQVHLADGSTVTADDAYIRESILDPRAKVVAGFAPIMPTFQGSISEEGIVSLIAYLKSLGGNTTTQTMPNPPTGGASVQSQKANAASSGNAAETAPSSAAGTDTQNAPSGTGTIK